jgi:hypothetical protein
MTPEEKLSKWLERKKAIVVKLESNLDAVPEHLQDSQQTVIDILKKNIIKIENKKN